MYDMEETKAQQYATAVQERSLTVTEELSTLVARLRETIDYGTEKLSNVLAPEYDSPAKDGSAPMPIASPIKEVEISLAANIARLRMLLDRVEA